MRKTAWKNTLRKKDFFHLFQASSLPIPQVGTIRKIKYKKMGVLQILTLLTTSAFASPFSFFFVLQTLKRNINKVS